MAQSRLVFPQSMDMVGWAGHSDPDLHRGRHCRGCRWISGSSTLSVYVVHPILRRGQRVVSLRDLFAFIVLIGFLFLMQLSFEWGVRRDGEHFFLVVGLRDFSRIRRIVVGARRRLWFATADPVHEVAKARVAEDVEQTHVDRNDKAGEEDEDKDHAEEVAGEDVVALLIRHVRRVDGECCKVDQNTLALGDRRDDVVVVLDEGLVVRVDEERELGSEQTDDDLLRGSGIEDGEDRRKEETAGQFEDRE
mmetsp:Transcript_20954/g.64741  ORF Transcript_20954/g.64741 Transcript_20954/m.64741 type:complete len:249 (+) Transcript_20954:124-870(+)